jgi:hydroxymethylpyrimidine pyrophosphatase-like HAD family hydrolase
MDGTLLNSKKSLTSRTKLAVKAAKARGVHVVLASGRPTEGMMPTAVELDLVSDTDYMLTYNASLILKTGTKEVISSAILTGKDVKDLYKIAQDLNGFFDR